jgi:hypothetical protein
MNDSFAAEYSGDPDEGSTVAALIAEYAEYVQNEHAICWGCPVVRSGVAIVGSMLEWKATDRDGRLDHWTRRDIRDYLLRYLPTVGISRELLEDAPTCAKDLIYFLADRGSLEGDDVSALADATDEVLYRSERPLVLFTLRTGLERSERRKTKRKAARVARRRNRRK